MSTPNPANNKDFPIVGIGASAGGLEALKEFFEYLPGDTGIGFVIIQHLSSDFKSMMPELLGRNTSMPIHTAKNKQTILPNNVYLIPVKKNIIVKEKVLYLIEKESSVTSISLPIDLFFNSLGYDLTDSLAGIILSGTGTDGSRGLKMIKEAGGLILAQDPESAKFDGMPNAAIATGLVDLVLEPHEMSKKLVDYFSGKNSAQEEEVSAGDDSSQFERILFKIKKVTGVDFNYYKKSTLRRRLEKKMNLHHLSSLSELDAFLLRNPEDITKLSHEFLIGITSFYRDNDSFEVIKKKVLPQLFHDATDKRIIRVWSAGCSTGEESYSLAFMMYAYLEEKKLTGKIDFKIFSSDLDEMALEKAGHGIYNAHQMVHLPQDHVKRYFKDLGENQFQVHEHIRKRIVFAKHNIIKDPPFIRLDFIACRNLLIYLEASVQKKILLNFHFALNPGGYLFLGSSESTTGVADDYKAIDKKWKIYKSALKRQATPMLRDDYGHLHNVVNKEETNKHRFFNKKKKSPYEEALIDMFSPNCVFVDKNYNVLYTKGNLSNFIHVPEREPSFSILKMTYERVSLSIRNGMRRALQEKTPISYKQIPLSKENPLFCDLVFYPVETDSDNMVVLITYKESDATVESDEYTTEMYNEESENRVKELELELDTTRQELQSALEELETSNEELQAANEELLASNEEMQSTNEELQSVNEELITVNSELQHKIKALEEANNDVNNLLSSTEIGTILLDENGCIRKFNLPAAQHFNLMEHDFGRPIYHLQKNFSFKGFKEAIKEVGINGKKIEREIYNEKDFFLLRILPYQLNQDNIGGIVLTFVEITKQRETQNLLENANDELRQSNDYLDSFIYTAAHDLRAPLVNAKNLLSIFEMAPKEKQNEVKKDLKQSIALLESTLSGLLEVIESQKNNELKIEEVSFKEIYDEVLSKLKSQVDTSDALLAFRTKGPESIVYSKAYLRSIMQNLISNAIKYRDLKRQPNIDVELSDTSEGFIKLSVKDNGIGIDLNKVKDEIFKPFKRFATDREGKGIGLNIINNMVKKNGGDIEVKSKLGEGSDFSVLLKPYEIEQESVES